MKKAASSEIRKEVHLTSKGLSRGEKISVQNKNMKYLKNFDYVLCVTLDISWQVMFKGFFWVTGQQDTKRKGMNLKFEPFYMLIIFHSNNL